MMLVEIIGGQLVIGDVHSFANAAKAGVEAGVKDAANLLARDVAEHTPRRSGRAAESVVVKESQGGKVQTVRYDYRKRGAFYMRFVILGAKAHTIVPKRLSARGKAYLRRRKIKQLVAGGMIERAAVIESVAWANGLARLRNRLGAALSIPDSGGGIIYRRSVRHPGIKGTRIFKDRMEASAGEIATTLQRAVRQNVERALAQRTSGRGARWTGGGWSHEK